MRMHGFRFAGLVLGTILIASLTGGCPDGLTPTDGEEPKPALQRFSSGDELLGYFREQALTQTSNGGVFGRTVNLLAPTAAEDAAAGGNGDSQGNDTSYSTTNIQEEGVDESDVFKSDGQHFFIAKGKTLRILNAVPLTDMAEIARVEFVDHIDSLYVLGSRIIVVGQKLNYFYGGGVLPMGEESMMWPPYYEEAAVRVSEVDISDPAAPVIVRENELDGSLVTSRLTNNRLILVLTITPALPDAPNFFNMAGVTLDEMLPQMRPSDGTTTSMVAPEDWYYPAAPNGYYTTAVVTLDADNVDTVVGSLAVMANAGTIYASTEAVYLTDTEYSPGNNYRETTAIHKLAFNADGVAEYVASGSVPGRLLNQFSLDEHDGYLRVATHVSDFGFAGGFAEDVVGIGVAVSEPADVSPDTAQDRDEPVTDGDGTTSTEPADGDEEPVVTQPVVTESGEMNAVYVLGENAGNLEIVGQIEDIAPGEQLYAARFMATHGFLVTFVQIDPLFVLDLADPTAPAIVGELKIPGYSDYLHPFGENLLIGVGRSARQTPWGGVVPDAVQVSLFDVTDFANPTLVDQLGVGGYGSSSDVSWTHKAFTFLPDRGLLAIPAELMSGQGDPFDDWDYYRPAFDGVICFSVDASAGFAELGRVSSVVYDEYGWTQWRRGAFIEDALYAVTAAGVRAVDLADFNTPSTLVLTPNAEEIGGDDQGGGGDEGTSDAGEASPGSPG